MSQDEELAKGLSSLGVTLDQVKYSVREFSKMCKMAEMRVKSFDRTNTQPHRDHAFMETLKEYIKNESDCCAPFDPSQEMLAKFAVKPGTENARVLAIFEDYFKVKRVKIPHEGITKSVREPNKTTKKYLK